MRIDIIGGGPAGSYAAYLLAREGFSVNVFEMDNRIGIPVQCTGILSDYFETLMKPDPSYIENIVEKTRIYSPDGNYIEAKIKKNYVISRERFDNKLADMAKKEGASYHLGHCFKDFSKSGDKIISRIIHESREIRSESDILIGADGPLSPVAKSAGLYKDRRFVIATQVEAKIKNDNAVEFYPYIGCYAWVVPKNKETVRIGVAAYKNAPSLFRDFAGKRLGKDYKKKFIQNQSGIIPLFSPRIKSQSKNIYLIGDAATFVKATSGGGVNQSLQAAVILADCIKNHKDYSREWKKKMFRNLYMHLIVHKMMQKFSSNDWNSMIKDFSDRKMKEVLFSESRDKLVKMLIATLQRNPSLLKFARYFPAEEFWNLPLLAF